MPMAKSVVTLFILISSAQISSSQRLAGSKRFLINVWTHFPDLGDDGGDREAGVAEERAAGCQGGWRGNCGQDYIWAMKYSSRAFKRGVRSAALGSRFSAQAVL